MTNAEIISWRESLRGGKNLPLRIIFDNQFNFDESLTFNFIKWDDANGIVYTFSLPNPADLTSPGNQPNFVKVFSAPYDKIWYIESIVPMDLLDDVFKSIEDNGCTAFAAGAKERIKRVLSEAIDPKRWGLEPEDINSIHGYRIMDDNVEYYRSRFPENFKETRDHALHNQYVKDSQNQNP